MSGYPKSFEIQFVLYATAHLSLDTSVLSEILDLYSEFIKLAVGKRVHILKLFVTYTKMFPNN